MAENTHSEEVCPNVPNLSQHKMNGEQTVDCAVARVSQSTSLGLGMNEWKSSQEISEECVERSPERLANCQPDEAVENGQPDEAVENGHLDGVDGELLESECDLELNGSVDVTVAVVNDDDQESLDSYPSTSDSSEEEEEEDSSSLSNGDRPALCAANTAVADGDGGAAARTTSDLEEDDSSSSAADTSDSDDDIPVKVTPGPRRYNEVVFRERYIETIEEVCECEHSHCEQWQQRAVFHAVREREEELEFSIGELQGKLGDTEKQLRRKDCLLGEKVLANQRLQRQVDELTALLEKEKATASAATAAASARSDSRRSSGGSPSDCAVPGSEVTERGSAAQTPTQGAATPSGDRQDSEELNLWRRERQQLSLKLQIQKLALSSNSSTIEELKSSNDDFARKLSKATAELEALQTSSHIFLREQGSPSMEGPAQTFEPATAASPALALSPPTSPPSEQASTAAVASAQGLSLCSQCTSSQHLLALERARILDDLSQILSMWQDGEGAECEVLIARLHFHVATKLQSRPVTPVGSVVQVAGDGVPPGHEARLPEAVPAREVLENGPLCARCEQLSAELFRFRQQPILEAISNKDTDIFEEERQLSSCNKQLSSTLFTLRREREDLVLKLKQMVSRRSVSSGYSGDIDSDLRDHPLYDASGEEIAVKLEMVNTNRQLLLDVVKSGLDALASKPPASHGLTGKQGEAGSDQDAAHRMQLLAVLSEDERKFNELLQHSQYFTQLAGNEEGSSIHSA